MDYRMKLLSVGAAVLSLALVTGCSTDRHASLIKSTPEGTVYGYTSSTDSMNLQLAEASKLIGQDLVGIDGRTVGVLDDIAVNKSDGRIAYGVVAAGGFMGMAETFHAIPWQDFTVEHKADGRQIIKSRLTEDSLKGHPGFDKKNWPLKATSMASLDASRDTSVYGFHDSSNMSSDMKRSSDLYRNGELSVGADVDRDSDLGSRSTSGIENEIYGYNGDSGVSVDRDASVTSDMDRRSGVDVDRGIRGDIKHAYKGDAIVANGQLVRLAKLNGWDLRHAEGNIAEVEQTIIDMKSGQVAYVAVQYNSTIDQLNNRWALIPWSALTFDATNTAIALRNNVDTSSLVAMSYDRVSIPDLSNPTVSQRMYSQYNVEPYWQGLGYVGDEAKDAAHDMKEGVKEGARELKHDIQRNTY